MTGGRKLFPMAEPHRKRLQHYNEPGHLHFMTFSCYRRLPLLTNNLFRTWLAHALNTALLTHEIQLSGFVFMPEHVHLLVWPQQESYSIAAFQQSLKRPFSARVKKHLLESKSSLLDTLTIQERPGKMVFRFWQEGGGHDLNVWSEKYIWTKLEYMHNNPVQRQLVSSPDQWNWSSWNSWHQQDVSNDPALPTVTILKF